MVRKRIGPTHAEVRAELLQDPEVRREYEALLLADRIARFRQERGLTQTELAERAGTQQPNIARVEAGKTMPDWTTLWRIAAALGLEVKIDLVPAEDARSAGG